MSFKFFKKDIENIIFLSDIHYGVRNNSAEWTENINSYFNNFFIPFIKKYNKKTDALIIAGDIFDNRQYLDINIMNIAFDMIERIASYIDIIIITGNHDIYKRYDNDINSLKILKHIAGVTVIEQTTILKTKFNNFLLIPWSDSINNKNILLNTDCDYVVMHADINGMTYENNRSISNGVDCSNTTFKKIFSGHIHKRQENKNIIYIGSPYQLRRSDINNDKGIYVLNNTNDELEFVKNSYSPIFQKFLFQDICKLTIQEIKSIFENNYNDIYIDEKDIKKFNIAKFIEKLGDCKYKKVEVILLKTDILNEGEYIKDSTNISVEDLIINKINHLKIKKEDKQKLLEYNSKYIEIAKYEI